MADTKVSGLAAATAALAADELPVNEAGASKKVTVAQLASFILAAGVYAPGSFTIPTGGFMVMARELILTGAQQAVLAGTAQLVLIG